MSRVRTAPGPRGALSRAGAAVLGAVLAAGLAGCTVGGDDPTDPVTGAGPAPSTSVEVEPSPSRSEATGPTPEELSAQVLADAGLTEEPVASVTAPVDPQSTGQTVDTTLDVLEVQRTDTGTLVRMQVSSATPYLITAETFGSPRFRATWFVRDLYLDDVAGNTRYLPLQFEDFRPACLCPYSTLTIGPEPQLLTAVFPELPDGTGTVTLRFGETPLAVEGLTVSPATS